MFDPRAASLLSSILWMAFFTSVYVWSFDSVSLHSSCEDEEKICVPIPLDFCFFHVIFTAKTLVVSPSVH